MPTRPSRGEAHSSALSTWDVGPGCKAALLGREAEEAEALEAKIMAKLMEKPVKRGKEEEPGKVT